MIQVITGPMFAGKTTRLHAIANELGHNALLVKPLLDTRYSQTTSLTHSRHELPCVVVESLSQIPRRLLIGLDCLLIDEGQFFPSLKENVLLLRDSIPRIVVGGLDMDYKKIAFNGMEELTQIANVVERLRAVCDVCGEHNASLTTRYLKGDRSLARIVVGDSSMYSPRCISCYMS